MSHTLTVDKEQMAKILVDLLRKSMRFSNEEIFEFIDFASNYKDFEPSAKQFEQVFSSKTDIKYEGVMRTLRANGFPPALLEAFLPEMAYYTRKDAGDFLNTRMLEAGLTTNDLESITGINKGYIYLMIKGDRPFPKYAIYVFSLCLKLNKEQADTFLKLAGKTMNNEIEDSIFRMFMELDDNDPKRYDIEEYIAACLTVAEKTGFLLPDYFYGGKKARDY